MENKYDDQYRVRIYCLYNTLDKMPQSGKKTLHNMVKVLKAPIVACLTCPLCSNLLREATTISECLHTFCKECIHETLSSEDEINCCPMCDVYLGCAPLEKLRADPQLDEVRAKLFPLLPRKRAASTCSAGSAPVRRKERSLSSLGLISVPSSSMTKKSKSVHASTGDMSSNEESDEEEQDVKATKRSDNSEGSSQEHAHDVKKVGHYKAGNKQSSASKAVKEASPSDSASPPAKYHPTGAGMFAQRSKLPVTGSSRTAIPSSSSAVRAGKGKLLEVSELQSALSYLAELADADAEADMHVDEIKPEIAVQSNGGENTQNLASSSHDLLNNDATESWAKVCARGSMVRSARNARKGGPQMHGKASNAFTSGVSDRTAILALPSTCRTQSPSTSTGREKGNSIWFVLQAAENQAEDNALPQISTPYIRIMDGRMPVSLVKKYLAKKLDLKSETEVEITCRGQPIVPGLPLFAVRNIWKSEIEPFQKDSEGKEDCSMTSSDDLSNEFLMVLTYGRNRRPMISH